MKKILKGIMVLSLCLVTSIGSVSATANKGGGIAGGGVGGQCRIKGMCNWNNSNFLALRAIFAYVDNGVIIESYHPFYFVIDGGNYLRDNVGIDSKYIYTASEWGATDISLSSSTRYKQASFALRDFFDDKKEDIDSDKLDSDLKEFIKKSVNTKKKYSDYSWKQIKNKVLKSRESQLANKNSKKAPKRDWRILIEPVFNYTYTGSEPRLWTVKEYAQYFGVEKANVPVPINGYNYTGKEWVNIQSVRPITGSDIAQSQYFFTTFNDVGVPSPKQNGKWEERRKVCTTISLDKLGADMEADPVERKKKIKHGCGLNIYDIGYQNEQDVCYNITYDKDGVTCEKNDTYNVGSYSTSIEETECKKGTIANNNKTGKWSKWGVEVAEINGCKLYVKENGRVKLPGGITKTQTLGKDIVDNGYFAWPARKDAKKGLKLEMKVSFLFRRIGKDKCTPEVLTKLYEKGYAYATSKLSFEADLTAGDNIAIPNKENKNGKLKVKKEAPRIYRKEKFENKEKPTFRVTTVAYLEIGENVNRIQERDTLAVRDKMNKEKKVDTNLFFDRGEGVISLSKNYGIKHNDPKKCIEEKTKNGMSNEDAKVLCNNKEGSLKLTNIKLGKNGKYTIKDYTCPFAIKEPTCVCPPKSPRAGENITEELKVVTGTCEQLQKELCYKNYYCYFNRKPYDITECVINKKRSGLNTADAVAQCSKEDSRCHTITCPNTNYNIPENDWDQCLNSEGNTATDCEEKLCKKVCYYMNKQTGTVEEKDISGCMANGLSETACTQAVCGSPCLGCKGICDKWNGDSSSGSGNLHLTGTGTGLNGETINCSIDINHCYKSCVEEKIGSKDLVTKLKETEGRAEGDIKEALEACKKEVVCPSGKRQNPDNSISKNVMFRTIDLKNPFPGSNGKTRKPGANWSVESDVKKYINNARGQEGYALYNAKPLYTIKLNRESIKKIKDYNKSHPYTSYSTLSCKGDDKTVCISTFLHNSTYVKIDNSKSVGDCSRLSVSSTKDDFKKCYGE